MLFFRKQWSNLVILPNFNEVTYLKRDTNWWVVWLGRHPAEKIAVGLKDKLIQFGNLELSAKAKACLTVFRIKRNAGLKDGISDLKLFFNRTLT